MDPRIVDILPRGREVLTGSPEPLVFEAARRRLDMETGLNLPIGGQVVRDAFLQATDRGERANLLARPI